MELLIPILLFLVIIFVVSKLFSSSTEKELGLLRERIGRIEKQLQAGKERVETAPSATAAAETPQPAVELKPVMAVEAKPSSQVTDAAALRQEKSLVNVFLKEVSENKDSSSAASKPLDVVSLEKYVGQRVIGWAAVALGIFAIGFFIKYAYDQGWIIPEGRVAIGEVIGLGLIAAGWRQHRRGNALGSQMLLGCGIAACYLATYAAFGFYQLISQPVAGLFMTVVMVGGGVLAVVTGAYSLGMLTVLGGLLTPLMLHTGQDQRDSIFLYLVLLTGSIHVLHGITGWLWLRLLVWFGALVQFASWYFSFYTEAARPAVLQLLAAMWLVPLVQILWRARRRRTREEDWILFLVTPLILFAIVYHILFPSLSWMRGPTAIGLSGIYGVISLLHWKRWKHDTHHYLFLLPLSAGLIFFSVWIPIELSADFVGVGWVTEGVILWGVGLWRGERVVRFFGLSTLLLGTLRTFSHDVELHQAVGVIPLLHAKALPALWMTLGWVMASWLAHRYQGKLKDQDSWSEMSIVAFWMFWFVLSIEVYPYFKVWQITNRWIAVLWMALAMGFFYGGCRLLRLGWRLWALLLIVFAVFRSLAGDLPLHRSESFVPLLNDLSLPVVLVAGLLLGLRPLLIRYESVLCGDEKHIKPLTGLAALAMILLILSLDAYGYCVVQYPSQRLLPHAVVSVIWSLYGGMLIAIGFWKDLATLRWSAIGIFGLTLGKVLMIDLNWLAGLYRILALLLIALVLGAVTWKYQQRK